MAERRVVYWVRKNNIGIKDVQVIFNNEPKGQTNQDGFIEFFFTIIGGEYTTELINGKDRLKVTNFPISSDMTIYWDFSTVKTPAGRAKDIEIRGENFYNQNELFRVQGATFFTDLLKFLQNDRNEEANEKLRDLGVNTKRVFGCTYYVGDLNPYQWPDYYDKLDRYFTYQKEQGFNVIFSAIARDGTLPVDLQSCKDFISRTSEIAGRHQHVLFSIANEPYQNLPTGVRPQDLVDSIYSGVKNYELGAYYEPKRSYEPIGTFETEHTPRDSEWDRKYRHIQEAREHYNVPSISAEPMGASSFPANQRDTDPQKFLEYFAGCAMYGGGVFHSTSLLQANIPGGLEMECFKAASRAWKYIDKKFLEGQFKYFFDDFSQGVPALKFYGVELGNEGVCVLSRRNPTVPLVPIGGWKIVEGPIENSILYLERE